MKEIIITGIGVLFIVAAGVFVANSIVASVPQGGSFCAITQDKVSIGHQESITVVAAGVKDWAVVQQPLNATNTVSLSLSGDAVDGEGYVLSPATTSESAYEFRVGQDTNIPTNKAVEAITDTGSTTVNVIYCR